jgi:hypothetical protein
MTETKTRVHATDILERYGNCLELVSMDTSFHDISVALYVKDGVCTVWTFSQREGVQERIERIRDNIIDLGGLEPVEGTHNQVRFGCGHLHVRPLRFLMSQAVGKARDYAQPGGDMTIKDTKTKLILAVQGREGDGRWLYEVSATGEAPNPPARLRLVVAGFVRYGEMEKVSDTVVAFPCGQRHDQMLRVLLPYSRNVSGVESMMEAEAMRGQMTTGTLGFAPPT